MVWKSIFCGGSNQGVIVGTPRSESKIMVKMKSGDLVVHNLKDSDVCEVVHERDWPAYCVMLGSK
jgi:hypothetical protein